MATVRTTVEVRITSRRDAGADLSKQVDDLNFVYTKTFTNGTGNNQVDTTFHDKRTLSGAQQIDLSGGLTFMGDAQSFADVRLLAIHNRSTVAAEKISLGSGINAWLNWVGTITDIVKVEPSGFFLLVAPLDGYAVVAGTGDILNVDPDSGTPDYDIILQGASA